MNKLNDLAFSLLLFVIYKGGFLRDNTCLALFILFSVNIPQKFLKFVRNKKNTI